jgi:hypothetical protein
LADSRAEVEKCAWACEWFADYRPAFLEPEAIEPEAARSQVAFIPLGAAAPQSRGSERFRPYRRLRRRA